MRKKTLKYMIVAVGTLLIATRLFQQKAPAYDKCEVILDAGHGGQDSGAVYGGFMEKDFNLEMAHEVRRCLEQKGIKVHMTRYKDEALGENELSDLKRRVQLANHTSCKYFVSLHANASNNHLAHGFEIYTNKKGTALANAVQMCIRDSFCCPHRCFHCRGTSWVCDRNPPCEISHILLIKRYTGHDCFILYQPYCRR